MEAIVIGGGGFLLAVLWFDLMFDVQVRGHEGQLPEEVLASIAGYYARVTTGARPMNRIVSLSMLVTVGGLVAQAVGDSVDPGWVVASFLLAVPPIVLAGAQIFPAAVRLGRRTDDAGTQSELARRIHRGHWYCFCSIAGLLVVQGAAVATS